MNFHVSILIVGILLIATCSDQHVRSTPVSKTVNEVMAIDENP